MSIKTKKQELPSWFRGEIYTEGAVVKNPFSGEEYKLNKIELSMYDFVKGAEIALELGIIKDGVPKVIKEMHDGLYWFRKNNPEAYMILLD